MRKAGYSTAEIVEYWTTTVGVAKEQFQTAAPFFELFIFGSFHTVFDVAEAETIQNVRSGIFGGSNSKGFLIKKTRAAFKQMHHAYRNQPRTLEPENDDDFFLWKWQPTAGRIAS